MSSFKIFDIAGSGMSAQSVRLNTTASNLANADSVSGDPNQVYKAKHPLFEAIRASLGANAASSGVAVRGIVENQAAPTRALRAGQSARGRQRLRLRAERQHGRGDGRHDLRVALVPEQRRSDEHGEGNDARHAAARPVISTSHESPCPSQTSSTAPAQPAALRSRSGIKKKDQLGQDGVPRADDRAAEEPGSVQGDGSEPVPRPARAVRHRVRHPGDAGARSARCRTRCAPRRCSTARAMVGRDVLVASEDGHAAGGRRRARCARCADRRDRR